MCIEHRLRRIEVEQLCPLIHAFLTFGYFPLQILQLLDHLSFAFFLLVQQLLFLLQLLSISSVLLLQLQQFPLPFKHILAFQLYMLLF